MGAKQSAPQPRYYLNQPKMVLMHTPAHIALDQIVDAIRKKDTATYTKLLDENKTEYQTKSGGDNVYPFEYALFAAIFYQNLDAIKLLVETYGADVNLPFELSCTPLDFALNPKRANPTIIRYLIEKGANLNYVSKCKFQHSFGLTPLAMLIYNYNKFNDIELVKFFIDHGADVNFKAKGTGTGSLLDGAVYEQPKNTELIEYLMSKGAKPSPDYHNKNMFLMHVIEKGAPVSYIKALIDSGAEVNSYNKDGTMSPLAVAVIAKRFDVVKLLVEKGAYVQQRHSQNILVKLGIDHPDSEWQVLDLPMDEATRQFLKNNEVRGAQSWKGGKRRRTYRKKIKKSKKTRKH